MKRRRAGARPAARTQPRVRAALAAAQALPETARLLAIIARLRGPGGCPWDRKQTLASLRPYLLEECYELLDAIDSGDAEAHQEELGDVLLQLTLHSQIRAERGDFDFEAVARTLADKLVRRHPHVFGDTRVTDADEVVKRWDAIKATEKSNSRRSILDGVPRHLPALQQAQQLQSRAARVGFDWPDVRGVLAKLDEELREVRAALAGGNRQRLAEELGDLLFSVVNLCRVRKVSAELTLRGTSARFQRRFQHIEAALARAGRTFAEATLAELDRHWEAAKRAERRSGKSKRKRTGAKRKRG